MTIVLSIEPIDGPTYQHGYHLGTNLDLAKRIVEEKFASMKGIRTMALIKGNKIIDVYDGSWANDR